MPRWLAFTLFFSIALLILSAIHYYFYRRLVVASALPTPWRATAKFALAGLVIWFPLSFFISRGLGIGVGRILLHPIYIWLGVMLILFSFLVLVDVVQALAWVGARLAGRPGLVVDPARRLLLTRVLAVAVVAAAFVASGVALYRGMAQPTVKRLEVTLPKLPATLDGFTIAQLTDLHLGPMRSGEWFFDVVAQTAALKPDLVAITGDFADATPAQLAAELRALKTLQPPHGVFFVTGNHEYFIDLPGWLRALEQIGIRVLANERVTVGQGNAAFDLAGVDDHQGRRLTGGQGPNVDQALAGRDPRRAAVLLAHQPRIIPDAAEHGVDLVLAGHTHGGQIWPWNYLVYLQQPYVSGLHTHRGTQLYVSHGTGFWGPPMRLGSTAEITLVTLRANATPGLARAAKMR